MAGTDGDSNPHPESRPTPSSAPPVIPKQRLAGLTYLSSFRAELIRARDQFNAEGYDEAERALRRLLAAAGGPMPSGEGPEPGQLSALRAATLVLLGRTLSATGRSDQAAQMFTEAVAVFDRSPPSALEGEADTDGHTNLGAALTELGRFSEAISALECAFTLGATSAECYRYLGLALQGAARYGEAERPLRKALELRADSVVAGALAIVLGRLGRTDDSAAVYEFAAVDAANRGNGEAALRLFDLALALVPNEPRILASKAENLRILGRNEEAVEVLERALTLDPSIARAWASLGMSRSGMGRSAEALDALDRAIALDPKFVRAFIGKGETLLVLGRYDEALALFDRALEFDPQHARAHRGKGDALRLLGLNDEALNTLDRALDLDPEDAGTLATRGQVLRALGRSQEAVDALQTAIERDPTLAWGHAELGVAFTSLGEYEDALTQMEKALQQNPRDGWALAARGDTLRLLGRDEEALGSIKQALDVMPRDAWVLAEKALVLTNLDRYDEALAAVELALEADPRSPWAVGVKAQILSDIGEFHQALEVLERLVEHVKLDPWALGQRAWALRNLGPEYAQQALDAYTAGSQLQPEEVAWYVGIADALRVGGDRERAKMEYARVLDQIRRRPESSDADALIQAGWVHFCLHQYDEAIHAYVEAFSRLQDAISHSRMALHTPYPRMRFALALALLANGQHRLAEQEYIRALDQVKHRCSLYQRGALFVAARDLGETMEDPDTGLRNNAEAQSSLRLLEIALANVSAVSPDHTE